MRWLTLLSFIVLLVGKNPQQAAAKTSVFTADFEGNNSYKIDTPIHGQKEWTSLPANDPNILIRGSSYGGGWNSHGQYLVVNGRDRFAILPELNTAASGSVKISLDVRPGDAVKDESSWAALLYIYDNYGLGIVSVKFQGSDVPNTGPIQVTDGGNDHYINSGFTWKYVDNNSQHHIDLVIYQTPFETSFDEHAWELSVDGGKPILGSWGGFFGSKVGSGTVEKISLRGGANNAPGGLVAYDNLIVEKVTKEIPENLLSSVNPEISFARVSRLMDSAYYNSGTRVDIARFDLEELSRQGKPAPFEIIRKTVAADKALRQQWLDLEAKRKSIDAEIRLIPTTKSAHRLRIENLSAGTSGESEWFGLRYAALLLPNGDKVKIEASKFNGGAYNAGYSYQCEFSPAAFVYGQRSRTHTMQAGFDLPAQAGLGTVLLISGIDDDKPGQTPIRILLDGVTLFEGKNDFAEVGWSEKSYPIPVRVWQAGPPSGIQEEVFPRLTEWKRDVKTFEKWSREQADNIDTITQPLRRKLVWKKRDFAQDWWRHGFMRGICFESDASSPPNERGRPWFADNFEYVVKAFDSARVNMVYTYFPSGSPDFFAFRLENEKIGTPMVKSTFDLSPSKPVARGGKELGYFLDAQTAARDLAENYIQKQSPGETTLRGIALDEPIIPNDNAEIDEKLAKVPEVLQAWYAYLNTRKSRLGKTGIDNLSQPKPVLKVETDADRVLWMEWQYFKMDFFTDFYAELFHRLEDKGQLLFILVQDFLRQNPQAAAYPYYGAKLPIIATDLYNNAWVREAYVMDLLRSVSKGKAILVPGSGYSAHTPDRFHRTLANSMLRADGVLQWIHCYASKYRARMFFAKPYMKDNRGREALDNWDPEYWEIQKSVFQDMEKAEPYLSDTQPTAKVAVLYSMRSVIAESATTGYWGCIIDSSCCMVYNALINWHRSIEACMVEGLTPEKLKRYRVLFLINAPTLTLEECALLRNWISDGGTLVVGGETSLQDEWGRAQPDYALADVFGLHFAGRKKGESLFSTESLVDKGKYNVEYDTNLSYAKVVPERAAVLATWGNGDPALLVNPVGRGRVYFITACRPDVYSVTSKVKSGLYPESRPGFPLLFREIASRYSGEMPVDILGAPTDLEVNVRQKGKTLIIHMLDWQEDRTVNDLRLKCNLPGNWKLFYPMVGRSGETVKMGEEISLGPVRIHEMVVLEQTDTNPKK
ncbi:MAG: beta-galactosidase trimerization domain-containing protein [Candidatus Omnitrophota bacterium]